MKRKTRTITVNNIKYIWWYRLGEELAEINISPFNDKTSIFTINFTCDGASDFNASFKYIGIGTYPEYIEIQKNNLNYKIKTISPKTVDFVLSNLTSDDFITRKHVIFNGIELLNRWGYTVLKILNGIYW